MRRALVLNSLCDVSVQTLIDSACFMHMNYAKEYWGLNDVWVCVSFGAKTGLTELHFWCDRRLLERVWERKVNICKTNNQLLTHQSPFSKHTGTHTNKSHIYKHSHRPSDLRGVTDPLIGHLFEKVKWRRRSAELLSSLLPFYTCLVTLVKPTI